MVAHPVTQAMASQLQLDILDLSKASQSYWGCSNTSNKAGAEDGEEITPVAGTGNE